MIIPKAFQYIPCYGLSLPTATRKSAIVISIHHMLRFITTGYGDFILKAGFQYIPCYGLSLTFLDSTPNMFHFNTSHVTVYLAPKVPHSADNGFQYIPCYGLSKGECCKVVVISPFQYIPCYGLSALGAGLREPPLYFNTSHVTVYRRQPLNRFRPVRHFNTSHVTVYRYFADIYERVYRISIHPMLRFIISATDGTLFFKNFNTSHVTVYLHWCTEHKPCFFIFQYIPCYGLSSNTSCGSIALTDFNTSHVTVYLGCNLSAGIFLSDFNTSHVTVYL